MKMDIQIFKQQTLPVRDKLYRMALKMLHDTAEAEDVFNPFRVVRALNEYLFRRALPFISGKFM
jgi:hypothetical protein